MIIAVPEGLTDGEAAEYRLRVSRSLSRRQIPVSDLCEPLSAGVSLLTSLSLKPKHLEVQSQCLDSWSAIGCKIIAQNTRQEIESLRLIYPQVHQWIECDDTSVDYDYPTQKLIRLAESAVENDAAIINSDIKLLCRQTELKNFLERQSQEFILGVRWNYQGSPSLAREFRWGFDLITLSDLQLKALPVDMPFAIGQPMWDYALPEILGNAGFTAKIPHSRVMFHKDHPQHWSSASHKFGKDWLSKFTGRTFRDVEFRRTIDRNFIYSEELGRYQYNHWLPLHWYGPLNSKSWNPSKAQRWLLDIWTPGIPNVNSGGQCNCSANWKKLDLDGKLKPRFEGWRGFFEWSWLVHNEVSLQHSKKPTISLKEAFKTFCKPVLGE